MASTAHAIPVVMYHSIGRVLDDWAWSNLTTPWRVFEDHLRCLQRDGWQTVDLYALHDYLRGQRDLPRKSVVLTFDDGYVDNWTYAAPLLARYGRTGTILVTPEFVDPRDIVRPTMDDGADVDVRGFMSWPELRRVAQSGVLSVQSHAMTHTWYPVSDRVVDYHRPGDAMYWLDWNAHPESKPSYLLRPGTSAVAWGIPVYEHRKSLECTRFFPDPGEAQHMAGVVAARGGAAFFDAPGWKSALDLELSSWRSEHPSQARVETAAEKAQRLNRELVQSKSQIEREVGKPVDFLVWPGGGYDDDAMTAARDIYKAVTISKKERWQLRNRPGQDPWKIARWGAPSIGNRYMGGRYLTAFIDEFAGSTVARRRRQLYKLFILAKGARKP